MDPIAALQQLDQECIAWANHHAHSCNLIASLLNITRQREQTLHQWQQQQQAEKSCSSTHRQTSTTLLPSASLQLLVHKQSLEVESVIAQLYDTINVFKNVVQGLVTLERQVETALQQMDISTLLDTTHTQARQQPSLSESLAESQPASSRTSIPAKPLSTTAASSDPDPSFRLVDTAEISPLEVLDWVGRVRAMYAQELNLKQAQIHPAMTALDRFETLADLQKTWGLQTKIDFGLEQEIVERIKAYRRGHSRYAVPGYGARRGENWGRGRFSKTHQGGTTMPFHEENEYPHLGPTPPRGSHANSHSRASSTSSRHSSFDASNCPDGVLKAVLESSLHAKQFFEDLLLSEPTFLRELDLTLAWCTTYNDLKLLRDAVLKIPQILKLRLDCQNQRGPKHELVYRGKRANPLVHIMMQHKHLVLIDFVGVEGFFSRSSVSSFYPDPDNPTPGPIVTPAADKADTNGHAFVSPMQTYLREVHIDGDFDPKAHAQKLQILLDHSPRLLALTLSCKDLEFCSTVHTIRELVEPFKHFRFLDLTSPLFTTALDRQDPTCSFARFPQREDIKAGIDNPLNVIEKLGPDLETVTIDESFADEHCHALERVTRERSKLKLIEMRIGFALLTNSAITEEGQQSLTMILRRDPPQLQPPQPQPHQPQPHQPRTLGQDYLQVPGQHQPHPAQQPQPQAQQQQQQRPTELIFAISHDRTDWFTFLGGVLDRACAIRISNHSLNKWLPLLEQALKSSSADSNGCKNNQSTNTLTLGPTPNNASYSTSPSSSHHSSPNPGTQPPTLPIANNFLSHPTAYAIRVLEIRGTGGDLSSSTVASLARLLSLATHIEILSLAAFDITNATDWETTLKAVSLSDLKELSLEETNVDGHQIALLMNRMPMPMPMPVPKAAAGQVKLNMAPLKLLHLTKTNLKPQDVTGLRAAMKERIPNCRLVV
ncbi:hypothetical protein EC968_003498 [Mortierella alpina]|nr:hypothetical protein EC968_003498 [Mortierella alpina]